MYLSFERPPRSALRGPRPGGGVKGFCASNSACLAWVDITSEYTNPHSDFVLPCLCGWCCSGFESAQRKHLPTEPSQAFFTCQRLCGMPGARTRPGLVREALLDGRIYWESTGLKGFVQQWNLTAKHTHPVWMTCKSHRLSPLSACEHRSEGLFQLVSGFIGR